MLLISRRSDLVARQLRGASRSCVEVSQKTSRSVQMFATHTSSEYTSYFGFSLPKPARTLGKSCLSKFLLALSGRGGFSNSSTSLQVDDRSLSLRCPSTPLLASTQLTRSWTSLTSRTQSSLRSMSALPPFHERESSDDLYQDGRDDEAVPRVCHSPTENACREGGDNG